MRSLYFKFREQPIRYRLEPAVLINSTDLWRAVGSPTDRRPSDWLKRKRVRDEIDYYFENLTDDPTNCLVPKRGRQGGTWMAPLISLGYTSFLGKEVSSQVATVFVQQGIMDKEEMPLLLQPPALETLNPSEVLRDLVYVKGLAALDAPNPRLAIYDILETLHKNVLQTQTLSASGPTRIQQLALELAEHLFAQRMADNTPIGYQAFIEAARKQGAELSKIL